MPYGTFHCRMTSVGCPIIQGMYIPDDISQIPDNHPSYVPAPSDRRERLTILLHKRLDEVIDQEQQPGISQQDRERLSGLHQQIREDMASIRYGATEETVRDLERRYRGWLFPRTVQS